MAGQSIINADDIRDPADWEVSWEHRLAQIYLWDATLYRQTKNSIAIDAGTLEFLLHESDVFGSKRTSPGQIPDIGAVELPD